MNTNINFAGIKMKNPVTVASGTFGYGKEFSSYLDLNKLGGIFTKGTSLKPRHGNKPPRVCESPSEFMLAGASTVSIGAGIFYSPDTSIRVIGEIESYLEKIILKI